MQRLAFLIVGQPTKITFSFSGTPDQALQTWGSHEHLSIKEVSKPPCVVPKVVLIDVRVPCDRAVRVEAPHATHLSGLQTQRALRVCGSTLAHTQTHVRCSTDL